jgi:hypothetical protein
MTWVVTMKHQEIWSTISNGLLIITSSVNRIEDHKRQIKITMVEDRCKKIMDEYGYIARKEIGSMNECNQVV